MDCPHCGGFVDTRGAKPLQHPCFDDATRRILVGGAGRRLEPGEWRILSALRERFRRFVPPGFLAQISARDPLDGGSVDSACVRIGSIRRQLDGSPFAIANSWDVGYGLFPADEVIVDESLNGARLFRLAPKAR